MSFNTYKVGEKTSGQDPRIKYNDFYTFKIMQDDIHVQKKLKQGFLFGKYITMVVNSYLNTDDVVIDVGANIGTLAIPISKMIPDGCLHAF